MDYVQVCMRMLPVGSKDTKSSGVEPGLSGVRTEVKRASTSRNLVPIFCGVGSGCCRRSIGVSETYLIITLQ